MKNEYLYKEVNGKFELDKERLEINVDRDIKEIIKDFYFSEDDLKNINIPKNINKITRDIRVEEKRSLRRSRLSWLTDIILVFIIISPIVGISNPNLFSSFDRVHPVFVRLNKFFEKENLYRTLGLDESNQYQSDTSKEEFIYESEVKKVINQPEELNLIHNLSNTIIESDYKWKCIEITPKTIQRALDGVDYINDVYDRVYFRDNLNRWKEGDFSNAVEVHNRVWSILGGSVGEAKSLDDKAIENIKAKYFK